MPGSPELSPRAGPRARLAGWRAGGRRGLEALVGDLDAAREVQSLQAEAEQQLRGDLAGAPSGGFPRRDAPRRDPPDGTRPRAAGLWGFVRRVFAFRTGSLMLTLDCEFGISNVGLNRSRQLGMMSSHSSDCLTR